MREAPEVERASVGQPGDGRARSVQAMFSRIAQRYDLLNSVMTWGQDRRWRALAAALARPSGERPALDVATGTGALALELARYNRCVVGVDFSASMLVEGARRLGQELLGSRVELVLGDAMKLPFADGSFQCATVGFNTRNVVDIAVSFAEMSRVVCPGGRVVCLEMTRPSSPWLAPLHRAYLNRLVPWLGAYLARDRPAYAYLGKSLEGFPTVEGLKAKMESAGLVRVKYLRLAWGSVAIHVGERPE